MLFARDRLVGAVHDLDRRDRAERLHLRELRVLRDVGQKRRLVVRPFRLPADEHLRALRDGIVDAALDGLERLLVDERPDDRVVLLRIARLEPLRLLDQPVDEGVGDATLDDDLPCRHADLALVEERAEGSGVDGVVEIRIVEDDERVVAAELEHDPLEVASGRLGDLPSRVRRAREVDAAHGRMLGELLADRSRLARTVGDDVEHSRREAGLGEDLPHSRPPEIGDHSDGFRTTVLP